MSRRTAGTLWAAFCVVALALGGCAGGKASPKSKPIVHDKSYSLQLAQSQFNAGRVSEALATLDEAIERSPDDAGLYHVYGTYCLRGGRHAQAIAAFGRALALDPHLTDARNSLGVVYLMQQRYPEAEAELLRALEDPAYPTPQEPYLNLGLLYAEQGRDQEALEALRRSVGIDPKYFKAHFHLASILDRVGNLLESAREYEVAEPGFRNDGEYWWRRGFAYYRLGHAEKARDSLLRVRAVAPGSESAARADEILAVLD